MARIHSIVAIAVVTFISLGLLFLGVSPADAADGITATIKVGERGTHVRSTLDITSKSNIVGGLHNGDTVRVYCIDKGPTASGSRGTTDVWNRIGTRRWVSSAFTGVTSGPKCAAGSLSAPRRAAVSGPARVDTNGSLVRVRSAPSITGRIAHRYKNGTPVKLSCVVPNNAENRSWLKLASGAGYIAAEYVADEGPLQTCSTKSNPPPNSEPPSPPSDNAVQPGCDDFTINQRTTLGYTWYAGKLSVHFCWTGGPQSQIYNVRGIVTANANFPAQTNNALGPANEDRIVIDSEERLPDGVMVYGFFDSRTCMLGDLDGICSGWTTNRLKVRLFANGDHKYEGQD